MSWFKLTRDTAFNQKYVNDLLFQYYIISTILGLPPLNFAKTQLGGTVKQL